MSNKLKKLVTLAIALSFGFGLLSQPSTAHAATLTVSPQTWNPSYLVSSRIINVSSDSSWKATSSTKWLKLVDQSTKKVGNSATGKKKGSFSIKADKNPNATLRIGTITVKTTNLFFPQTKKITVTQSGHATLTVSPTTWKPSAVADQKTAKVTSNTSWTATSNTTWLKFVDNNTKKDAAYAKGTKNGSFTIKATTNTTTVKRSGKITVTAGNATQTITVTQARFTLAVSSTNSNPNTNNTFGTTKDKYNFKAKTNISVSKVTLTVNGNSKAYSMKASSDKKTWTLNEITLPLGNRTITIKAYPSTANAAVTDTVKVNVHYGNAKKQVVYSQTDPRWSSLPYGGRCKYPDTIGGGGCGVAAMAMIITYMTKKEVTPKNVGEWAEKNNYYACGKGSDHAMSNAAAKKWGLKVDNIVNSQSAIEKALKNNRMVWVCGSGKAPFTSNGHCIAIRGITSNGNWLVFDSANKMQVDESYKPNQIYPYITGTPRSIYK
ncbi:MAG: C39 family peptidase [Propionibacteriaceae bacterium]|nr:C39 family peptidase [Propionibacteriaceae bacterium]